MSPFGTLAGMSLPFHELRALSDDEVAAAYDKEARRVSVGLSYWGDELERRSRERLALSADRLARRSLWLSVVSAGTSVLALVVAVVTLIVTA